MKYPDTRTDSVVDEYYGKEVSDPYRWLEDDNSEETKAWVMVQNELSSSYLRAIPFRDKIKQRLTDVWNYEKQSVPFKRGEALYFYKNNGLQAQDVLYRQLDGGSEVFFDPNTLSADGTVALNSTVFSGDGKYMVYSISRSGSDWCELFVLNTVTKEQLTDHIQWVKFSGMAWYKDGFFYSAYDAPKGEDELKGTNLNQKVYYHKLGAKQNEDELVYEDTAHPNRGFYVKTTEDESLVLLNAWEGTDGNILLLKNLNEPDGKFIQLNDDFNNTHELVTTHDDELIIHTNYKAAKYRLLVVDCNSPRIENWKEIVAESDNLLEDVSVGADKLVLTYLKDVHTELQVHSMNGDYERSIVLPQKGTIDVFRGKQAQNVAYYSFTSYTSATKVFSYDFTTQQSTLLFAPSLGFDESQYQVEQVFFSSKDGTSVPMEIVRKKGLVLNGNNPTLLYGYGGFNISLKPNFVASRIPWLENGGIYVSVHLRGGGEYGEEWHEAGTKQKKQNVFDDFIAAAEWLIDKNYTSANYLAAMGGSNGGLLVGAVVNQRPDLFRVAFPAVGVMDMLRYQHFTIGWAWAGDYGRSDDSEEMFNYLAGYSPLHTVKDVDNYPSVLVTTADHDDRVVPAHSFKYMATLQNKPTGAAPKIIRIDVNAGHGAGKPTEKRISESADLWAFAFHEMSITPYQDE